MYAERGRGRPITAAVVNVAEAVKRLSEKVISSYYISYYQAKNQKFFFKILHLWGRGGSTRGRGRGRSTTVADVNVAAAVRGLSDKVDVLHHEITNLKMLLTSGTLPQIFLNQKFGLKNLKIYTKIEKKIAIFWCK